jgi:hypothetical protein
VTGDDGEEAFVGVEMLGMRSTGRRIPVEAVKAKVPAEQENERERDRPAQRHSAEAATPGARGRFA